MRKRWHGFRRQGIEVRHREQHGETTAIVAQLELHSLDGSVDFLFAGDAVPFQFFTERASYPAPE